MKILITSLSFVSCAALCYGQLHRPVGIHPQIESAIVVDRSDGKSTIELKFSSPAFLIDDVPVVIFFRPTIGIISIVSPNSERKVQQLVLPNNGRGFRSIEHAIPLMDAEGEKAGAITFDSKEDTKALLELPSDVVDSDSLLMLGIVKLVAIQTIEENKPNKAEMATPRKPSD